ncbi:hypothetical protein C1H46_045743 [Malus baccata]|uniref:Uncharacterized protein n=1 Tax=Malus baccata TaxID=106549 RepID=A0A540K397_MALBA|nr:hypothetical protein C1H46_045743 [Malus baccata]
MSSSSVKHYPPVHPNPPSFPTTTNQSRPINHPLNTLINLIPSSLDLVLPWQIYHGCRQTHPLHLSTQSPPSLPTCFLFNPSLLRRAITNISLFRRPQPTPHSHALRRRRVRI